MPEAREDGGRPERVRALVSDLGSGLLLAVSDDLGRITEVAEAVANAFLWTGGFTALLGIGGGVSLSRVFLARVDVFSRTLEAIISVIWRAGCRSAVPVTTWTDGGYAELRAGPHRRSDGKPAPSQQ